MISFMVVNLYASQRMRPKFQETPLAAIPVVTKLKGPIKGVHKVTVLASDALTAGGLTVTGRTEFARLVVIEERAYELFMVETPSKMYDPPAASDEMAVDVPVLASIFAITYFGEARSADKAVALAAIAASAVSLLKMAIIAVELASTAAIAVELASTAAIAVELAATAAIAVELAATAAIAVELAATAAIAVELAATAAIAVELAATAAIAVELSVSTLTCAGEPRTWMKPAKLMPVAR
jgi:hypothetical protein